ncbi:SGNH/GDSL hydrolase family protein [Streptomyces sp. NPDC052225]|uniref:SGNH/GDSL hydrolase family protein n=1 Tax=Streptomyces sp. NPDC052225 TaxID=3154949 RepID=UPI0034279EA8
MRPRRSRQLVAAALAVVPLLLGAQPAGADAGHRYHEYVALGDSWSADVTPVGIRTDQAPSGCAQSGWNYPRQVAKALKVAVFKDATCGAATSAHLRAAQDVTYVPGLLDGVNKPQLERVSKTTDLVTFGFGGNDIGLAGAAVGCVDLLPSLELSPGLKLPAPLGGDCRSGWVKPDGTDLMSRRIAEAEPKLVRAVEDVRAAAAPDATVLVVDYLAGVPVDHGCYPYVQAQDGDLMWLGEKLKELNAMLERAAKEAGAGFVDTYSGSVGHDVCQVPGTKWVEGFVPLSAEPPFLAVPLHPNRRGAGHQAAAVLNTLKK